MGVLPLEQCARVERPHPHARQPSSLNSAARCRIQAKERSKEKPVVQQLGTMVAHGAAQGDSISAGLGHPKLIWFDDIRALFAETGLPPEPETYELFYLHISGADAALSRDIERLRGERKLTLDAVEALRRGHVADIGTS